MPVSATTPQCKGAGTALPTHPQDLGELKYQTTQHRPKFTALRHMLASTAWNGLNEKKEVHHPQEREQKLRGRGRVRGESVRATVSTKALAAH